jgi:hypothetical protein
LQRDSERRAEALSLAAWRRRPELVHRVHGILGRKPALNLVAARVLLGAVACALLVSSIELARCPQLVGFVAAPKPQDLAQADAVNVDRAPYAPALTTSVSGFHMVETKAILSPNRSKVTRVSEVPDATPAHRAILSAPATADREVASRGTNNGTPHETLLKAEMPSSNARQVAQQESNALQNAIQPEYIVFTAYEQVQTVPQSAREIADYDISAPVNQNEAGKAAATPAIVPTTQITVTRLIFKIDSATAQTNAPTGAARSAASGPSAESPSKPAPSSKPVQQPTVIHFGNGWLVFQL